MTVNSVEDCLPHVESLVNKLTNLISEESVIFTQEEKDLIGMMVIPMLIMNLHTLTSKEQSEILKLAEQAVETPEFAGSLDLAFKAQDRYRHYLGDLETT